MSSNPWHPLGTVPVSRLTDARLQLHWAAQIVASFGNAVIEHRADDSQSTLGWVESLNALCSHPSPNGLSVGLRLGDRTLLLLDKHQNVISECVLPGHSLQKGFAWLESTYSKNAGSGTKQTFALREYEMPAHPVGQNGTFSIETPAPFQEFQHWYANAHGVLTGLSKNWQQASDVRCWPHHFDIATLVSLDLSKGAEEARSVGCGMSPGDHTYSEPYWYVTPWPYPDKSTLPNLTVGKWHTEGWVGAILTASDLVGGGPMETQAERVHQFFKEGTQASFTALGADPT